MRLAIYRGLAATGVLPTSDEIAHRAGLDPAQVRVAIDDLAANRHVALDRDGRIGSADPFATRNFGFSVMGARTLWWGGRARDSFAIPHLVPAEPSVLVATTCPACNRAHSWVVDRHAEPHATSDGVVRTCENQRIFCSVDSVDARLARTGHER